MSTADYSRAIISSLFSPPPGTNQPPQENFVAYVQTFEPVPNSDQRKPRFLIVSTLRDGRLRLHKAKQNANGTFSIGKTWNLEDLRQVEVSKRMYQGRLHPLEFTLVINGKSYRYETDLPSSQQAAFLVTVVRCWRRFMNSIGRAQPDLVLIGFSVDTPNPAPPVPSTSTSQFQPQNLPPPSQQRPTTPSAPSQPQRIPVPRQQATYPDPRQQQQASSSYSRSDYPGQSIHRPSSAASTSTTGSRLGTGGGGPTHLSSSQSSSQFYQPPQPQAPPGRISPAPPPPHATSSSSSAYPIDRPPSSASTRSQHYPPPNQQRKGSYPDPRAGTPDSVRSRIMDPRDVPPPQAPTSRRQATLPSESAPPPPSASSLSKSSAPVVGMGIQFTPQPSTTMNTTRDDPRPPLPSTTSSSSSTTRVPPSSSTNGRSESPTSTRQNGQSTNPIVSPTPRRQPTLPDESHLIDESTILSNVEEMLEGFEWRGSVGHYSGDGGSGSSGGGGGGKGRKADEIEKRLIGELKALEAASIHAIMETDDRVTGVIKHLDDALGELDRMDLLIGLYKTQLNLVTDDIGHIESQNRGLQVQTSNQRALLSELDKLMSTIHIAEQDLTALSQESLENPQGIEKLERAAVSLYKALLSTRDTAVGDMAAASERVGEYRTKADQFCKRILDFLSIMFKFQIDQLLNPKNSTLQNKLKMGQLPSHDTMEDFLGRYCGLMLFVKEIDTGRYGQICSAYFAAMGDLHRHEIQELLGGLKKQVKKATEDELDASFATRESPTMRQQSIRRAGTLVRSPLETGKKDKDKDGKMPASEAFSRALEQILPHLSREQGFIADFLHISTIDTSITFADYMMLETFFRRGASTYLASQQGKFKDIRAAMEGVFGWLETEVRDWVDGVLQRDPMQVVGILAVLNRFIEQGERQHNEFVSRVLQKQYQKSLLTLERSCKEQIRSIEQTKLTLKKRKGVVPFVRIFPLFVARVESQLEGCEKLDVRNVVNSQYERIVATMFDCLQQMAKMDGEGQGQAPGEGKDQLNYHVILIENMHHIIAVFSGKQKVAALAPFVQQAREKYDQNLAAYIRLILRRPLSRVVDYFAGLEQLLRTTPPTEVSLHSAYTKSALRRILSDVRPKDLRKAIDALYKRVDKHFGADISSPAAEHTDVSKTVWKACEDELTRLTTNWRMLVQKCYPDEKNGLEVSRSDIHNFFLHAQSA
ncbi:uncharacterized protein JCM6883_002064 [Sporobolomyces salmoneus]|uniref:uncharacterized protein n=1 Tax=Sporobolomyces salmoneus TaxID=183962 RepID=UPI00316E663E